MAIPLGRSSPSASCDRPERRRGGSPGTSDRSGAPAAPTWSCSRWGFPCRRRCRRRGALLPHHFTLAARPARRRQAGGVFSVALSLGSPPPGVTRHRASVEPGLSSPRTPAESGHPTVWHGKIWAAMGLCQSPRRGFYNRRRALMHRDNRERNAMPVILGTDGYRYEVSEGWVKLPPGMEFNADVAAVGVDRHDNVY